MSKIEWLKRPGTKAESWNMIGGCTPVSAGCVHCYAARQAMRMQHHPRYEGTAEMRNGVACWTGRINLDYEALNKPLSWRSPCTVFPCSMADLFHPEVPLEFVELVYTRMQSTARHTYMILTKRPNRMDTAFRIMNYTWNGGIRHRPLPNAWLGITAESQRTADARRADFEAVPAAVKFVSYEPALGPVDWAGWEFIDMLIFGGESGPKARPAHVGWFRDALAWCRANGVKPFFKQHGAWSHESQLWKDWQYEGQKRHIWSDGTVSYRVGKKAAGHLLDGKVIREWPLPTRSK